MKNHLLAAFAMTAVLASSSLAQNSGLRWSDDFESYAPGQMTATPPVGMNPVVSGGYDGWDGDPNVMGTVVPNPSGAGQVLEIVANNDHLWNFTNNLASNGGHDTGKGTWVFEIDVYFPSSTAGNSYYLVQNDYNHFGPYNWSIQCTMNGSTGQIVADYGAAGCSTATLPTDRWFTYHTEAYIDANSTALGKGWTRTWILDPNNPAGASSTLLVSCAAGPDPRLGEGYNWVDGVFGGATNNGSLQFENLDLYGDPAQAGPVYYDNPRCWEKPDLLHIDSGALTGAGVPYIPAATGGSADLVCNGDYQDEGAFCIIAAGFNGATPGFPLGGVTLPVNLPDPLFLLMIQSPNSPGAWPNNIEALGQYGAKPNTMQMILPAAPFLTGTGFTLSFGAVVFDIFNGTFRWAAGGSLQWD